MGFSIDRRSVAALQKIETAGVFYDSKLTGFGVRLTAKGIATYFIEYRPGAGGRGVAKRRMVIGKDSPVFRADNARCVAEGLLARVVLGHDPAGEKVQARRAETVSQLLDAYIERKIKPLRKPATAATFETHIALYLKPELGARRLGDITRADVARIHRKIGETKAVTANRVVALLSAAYGFGVKEGLLPEDSRNPAAGIDKFRENGRQRYLSTDEMKRLGRSLALAESEGLPWLLNDGAKVKHRPKATVEVIDTHAAAAIRLILLTGARLREILHLQWSQVDIERGLLLLPDSKTGQKAIVIGAAPIDVLKALERVGPYVIPGRLQVIDGKPLWRPRADLKRPWARVSQHAGIPDVRIHDLRHSFASIGAGAGLGLPVIGALLGHADASTTQRYAHLDADPLHRAASAISESIAENLRAA